MVAAAWFWPGISRWLHEMFHISWHGIRREFFPALLLGAVTLLLLFFRVVLARFFRGTISVVFLEGFERTLTRFLGETVRSVIPRRALVDFRKYEQGCRGGHCNRRDWIGSVICIG